MDDSGITFAIIIFPIILTVSSMMFQLKPPFSDFRRLCCPILHSLRWSPMCFFVLKTHWTWEKSFPMVISKSSFSTLKTPANPATGCFCRYGSPVKGQVLGGRWKPLHYLYRRSAVGDGDATMGCSKKYDIYWYLRWSKDIFSDIVHIFFHDFGISWFWIWHFQSTVVDHIFRIP